MTARVLQFDQQLRLFADLDRGATLRRVRLAAAGAGCNAAERADLERHAQHLLNHGKPSERVIQACRAKAIGMVLARCPPVIA